LCGCAQDNRWLAGVVAQYLGPEAFAYVANEGGALTVQMVLSLLF
jgi:hypothetical protein